MRCAVRIAVFESFVLYEISYVSKPWVKGLKEKSDRPYLDIF